MNTRILVLCLFLPCVFACCILSNSSEKISGNPNRVEKIEISYISFWTCTIISVDCDSFDCWFPEKEEQSITDTLEINRILGMLENLEVEEDLNMNTRAKIRLCSQADTSTICVDQFSICKDGKCYKAPTELIDYIKNLNPNLYVID